jgi:hypothetical protein
MTCRLSFPNGIRITELNDKQTLKSGTKTGPSVWYDRSNDYHTYDAEARLFDTLADFFWQDAKKDKDQYWRLKKAVKGTVYIVSSQGPCPSCRGVIEKFMAEFRNVRVVVKYPAKYSVSQVDSQGEKYGYGSLTASGGYYTKILRSIEGDWDESEEEREKLDDEKSKG